MDVTFWTAVGAAGTIGASIGAIMGALVARRQLKRISNSTDCEALLKLYDIFEGEQRRANRLYVWKELQVKDKTELTFEEWGALTQMFTEMDVVGTMIKHELVNELLLFERYVELILPTWKYFEGHIQFRREQKGGFGWKNFEWLAEQAKKWSKNNRSGLVDYPSPY